MVQEAGTSHLISEQSPATDNFPASSIEDPSPGVLFFGPLPVGVDTVRRLVYSVSMRRDIRIYIRVTKEERQALLEAAAKEDRTLSDWLRLLALRKTRTGRGK